jgi:hypothetical protein
MHTTFCGDETNARERYDEMKAELERIMELDDDEAYERAIEEFVDRSQPDVSRVEISQCSKPLT